MPTLPTSMECSYNGHTFSERAETTDLRVTPVYDQAGRTVVYSVYAITVRDYISAATEAAAAALAQKTIAQLCRPAGKLRYTGRGFGDLVVNTGKVRDVVWGPKPRVIGLKPHGGPTVELTWQVEVAIPNCDDATFQFALMEFNFRLSFEKDRQGVTTRVYSGHVRIPQTRATVDTRTLSDTADAYLEKIYPPLLPGFRRTPGTWTLSEDKCRGDFVVTDEEMGPNALPLGVIDCAASHSHQSGRSLADWVGKLTASYTLDRGNNATFAIVAFAALLAQRMKDDARMRIGAALDFGTGAGKLTPALKKTLGQPVSLIPVAASAAEPDIYAKRMRVDLSVTYTYAGCGFGEVFSRSGLWAPVPFGAGGDWKAWAQSVDFMGARGSARLAFKPNEDAIVDLCGKSPPAALKAPGHPDAVVAGVLGDVLLRTFPPPTPAGSWLHYNCDAVVHPAPGVVPAVTLPAVPLGHPVPRGERWDALDGVPAGTGAAGSPFPPLAGLLGPDQTGATGAVAAHRRTRPQLYVTIRGQALRAGYQIPVPELAAVNGARPVLVGAPYFAQGVVAGGLVPIVKAEWQMTYLFTDDGGVPTRAAPTPPALA